ncbi:MAG: adenylate kinase family protein [Acidimicrobiales bacterium]
MRLLMVGPPGAGKGTQAARLASRYGIAHLSSGELFRQEVASGTPIGREAARYLARGDLVPDEIAIEMLLGPALAAARRGGYVLDGFPRTVRQAEEAYRVARQIEGVELQAVVNLRVGRPVLLARLRARGGRQARSDDDEATALHRLDVFDSLTAPVVGFYAGRGLVIDVNGEQAADGVLADIVAAIDGLRPGREGGAGASRGGGPADEAGEGVKL